MSLILILHLSISLSPSPFCCHDSTFLFTSSQQLPRCVQAATQLRCRSEHSHRAECKSALCRRTAWFCRSRQSAVGLRRRAPDSVHVRAAGFFFFPRSFIHLSLITRNREIDQCTGITFFPLDIDAVTPSGETALMAASSKVACALFVYMDCLNTANIIDLASGTHGNRSTFTETRPQTSKRASVAEVRVRVGALSGSAKWPNGNLQLATGGRGECR